MSSLKLISELKKNIIASVGQIQDLRRGRTIHYATFKWNEYEATYSGEILKLSVSKRNSDF